MPQFLANFGRIVYHVLLISRPIRVLKIHKIYVKNTEKYVKDQGFANLKAKLVGLKLQISNFKFQI